MKYLLDLDTCLYILNRGDSTVVERLTACEPSDVGVSALTAAALWASAEQSNARDGALQRVRIFLDEVQLVPFEAEAAKEVGRVRAQLARKGVSVPRSEVLVAAQAMQLGCTLVSSNTDLRRIQGLRVADWAAEEPAAAVR